MFVLCPHCQFLVATDSASGQPPLRCTNCNGVLLPEAIPTGPAVAAAAAPGDHDHDVATADDATVPALQPGEADAASMAAVDEDAASAPLDPEVPAAQAAPDPIAGVAHLSAPGFVRRQQLRIARVPHRRGWMLAAIAALSLLLVLQLLLADRAALARDPRWRPGLLALCGVLHCTLPPWHEPAAFTLLDRNVRPRPDAPGVLRVTATFRNDARWPQPWPALLLTLSDLDGRVAGARVFAPRDYLGAAPAQPLLASGQSAMLVMDVAEPGPRVVAFTFDFQ